MSKLPDSALNKALIKILATVPGGTLLCQASHVIGNAIAIKGGVIGAASLVAAPFSAALTVPAALGGLLVAATTYAGAQAALAMEKSVVASKNKSSEADYTVAGFEGKANDAIVKALAKVPGGKLVCQIGHIVHNIEATGFTALAVTGAALGTAGLLWAIADGGATAVTGYGVATLSAIAATTSYTAGQGFLLAEKAVGRHRLPVGGFD